ncbi:MAG: thiamine-phosphate kinase [Chitinispirillaceae bacterium]|nr:thiamine-phosphate kinase [Chitinispirillaceae bacterium]
MNSTCFIEYSMQQRPFPSAEYELISRIQSVLGTHEGNYYEQGIGDDAAIRYDPEGNRLIITTDLSVENVHFSRSYMSMREIGYRAMVSNLSDCAAMGALPDGAFVQLVIPERGSGGAQQVEELYRGFNEACKRWHFPVVGGDLSLGGQWVIGITLIGRVAAGQRVLLRKGMQSGDKVWVSGFPGRSAAGLHLLQTRGRNAIPVRYQSFADAHIRPVARIGVGMLLAADTAVHAMMDLSDGLSKDCRTLAHENGCGIILQADPSQVPQAMVQLSRETGRQWDQWFFHGGEDYELLFAASADFNPAVCTRAADGCTPLCIGECTAAVQGVAMRQGGTVDPLPAAGYDHAGALLQ